MPQLADERVDRTQSAVPGGEPPAHASPIPPRYLWTKRIAISFTALLLSAVGLRFVAGWQARQALIVRIQSYAAKGEPIYLEDFQRDPIPDEENAAILYNKAMTQLVTTLPTGETVWDIEAALDREGATEKILKLIADFEQANAAIWPLIREARQRDKVAWTAEWPIPNLVTNLRTLPNHRKIASLLQLRMVQRAHKGNDKQTFEAFLDVLAFAKATRQLHVYVHWHIGSGTERSALVRFSNQIASLRVLPPDLIDVPTAGVCPARLREVIAQLIDAQQLEADLIESLYAKRFYYTVETQAVTRCSLPGVDPDFVANTPPMVLGFASRGNLTLQSPMYVAEFSEFMDLESKRIQSIQKPKSAESKDFELPPSSAIYNFMRYPLTHAVRPGGLNFSNANESLIGLITHRRLTACAIALRLYEVETMSLPDSLQSLVPDYLPELPVDPYSENAQPIRYRRTAKEVLIYSVWRDGKDNGGEYADEQNRASDLVVIYRKDQVNNVSP